MLELLIHHTEVLMPSQMNHGGQVMAIRRVTYLTPQYFDDRSYIGGGERMPLNWARGVVDASRGAYAVEIISFGDHPPARFSTPA